MVVETFSYCDRGPHTREKLRQDHFVSKIGEEAVFAIFSQYTEEIEPPDYKIYPEGAKSWEPDLRIDGIGLAVKTQLQSNATKYGLSWMFQYGKYRKDAIFNEPEAWVCFVECNDEDRSYNCVVHPPLQMMEITFGEPKVPQLRGWKKVAYAKENGIPWQIES